MTPVLEALADLVTVLAAVAAAVFFTAGTIGLLRFSDLRSRLHALTKADSLGLGFVGLAVIVQVDSVGAAAKVLLVWLLALATAATAAYLLASDPEDEEFPAAEPPPAQPAPTTDPPAGRGSEPT